MPKPAHKSFSSHPVEIQSLLVTIELMRGQTFRRADRMREDLSKLIRRADRMLLAAKDTPHEQALRSGRALLNCMHCGLHAN